MRKTNPPPGVGEEASGGIWYYAWLKPDWLLFVDRSELAQHMCYWPSEIVPRLGFHYHLSQADCDELFPLYGAFPRGRVISINYGESFRLVHGGDFPSALDEFEEQKRLRHKFGLMRRSVTVEQHEHEMMISRHRAILRDVIGAVPY